LHEAPGASAYGSDDPQVVEVWIKSPEPVNVKLLMWTVVVGLLFAIVTVWYALVVPTGAVKLVIAPGVTETGRFPNPLKATVCGVPGPSSFTFSVAVLVPGPLGVKVTFMVQVPPGARSVQGVTAKSPLFVPLVVKPEKCSVVLWLFVTVTGSDVLVVPSNWAGKLNDVGFSVTAVCTDNVAGALHTAANW
jgi:hypothetical protein